MDLFLKFLILGGKYLSQLTAQSIVEAYKRSIQLGRALNHQCSQSVSIVSNYDSILEMYNNNLEELGTNADVHLAFISDHHRQEFETYLREVELLSDEDVTALLRNDGVPSASASTASSLEAMCSALHLQDDSGDPHANYVRHMALSILGSIRPPSEEVHSPSSSAIIADYAVESAVSPSSLQPAPSPISSVPVVATASSVELAKQQSTRKFNGLSPRAAMIYFDELAGPTMTQARAAPPPSPPPPPSTSPPVDYVEASSTSALNSVADFLDRQAEYINGANSTFRQLQLDISFKYEQLREQQKQRRDEEAARDVAFTRKLRAVQHEVARCAQLMKCAQDHFDVLEQSSKSKRLLVSIDKILKDVEAITNLMKVNDYHFIQSEAQRSAVVEVTIDLDDSLNNDANLNHYNQMLCRQLNKQLRVMPNRAAFSTTATTSFVPIQAHIVGFLAKAHNKEWERIMDVNQEAFEKHERTIKYPLIGRRNNPKKRSRRPVVKDGKKHRNRNKKPPYYSTKKKGGGYKCSKSHGVNHRVLRRSFLRTSPDDIVMQKYAALSSSWIKDECESGLSWDEFYDGFSTISVPSDMSGTQHCSRRAFVKIDNAIQRFLKSDSSPTMPPILDQGSNMMAPTLTPERNHSTTSVTVDEKLDALVENLLDNATAQEECSILADGCAIETIRAMDYVAVCSPLTRDDTKLKIISAVKRDILNKMEVVRQNTYQDVDEPFVYDLAAAQERYRRNHAIYESAADDDVAEAVVLPDYDALSDRLEMESLEAPLTSMHDATYAIDNCDGNQVGLQEMTYTDIPDSDNMLLYDKMMLDGVSTETNEQTMGGSVNSAAIPSQDRMEDVSAMREMFKATSEVMYAACDATNTNHMTSSAINKENLTRVDNESTKRVRNILPPQGPRVSTDQRNMTEAPPVLPQKLSELHREAPNRNIGRTKRESVEPICKTSSEVIRAASPGTVKCTELPQNVNIDRSKLTIDSADYPKHELRLPNDSILRDLCKRGVNAAAQPKLSDIQEVVKSVSDSKMRRLSKPSLKMKTLDSPNLTQAPKDTSQGEFTPPKGTLMPSAQNKACAGESPSYEVYKVYESYPSDDLDDFLRTDNMQYVVTAAEEKLEENARCDVKHPMETNVQAKDPTFEDVITDICREVKFVSAKLKKIEQVQPKKMGASVNERKRPITPLCKSRLAEAVSTVKMGSAKSLPEKMAVQSPPASGNITMPATPLRTPRLPMSAANITSRKKCQTKQEKATKIQQKSGHPICKREPENPAQVGKVLEESEQLTDDKILLIDAKEIFHEISADFDEKDAIRIWRDSNKLLQLTKAMNLKAEQLLEEYEEQKMAAMELQEILKSVDETPVLVTTPDITKTTLTSCKPSNYRVIMEEPAQLLSVKDVATSHEKADLEIKRRAAEQAAADLANAELRVAAMEATERATTHHIANMKLANECNWVNEMANFTKKKRADLPNNPQIDLDKQKLSPEMKMDSVRAPSDCERTWRMWRAHPKSRKITKSYTVVKTTANEITLNDMINGGKRPTEQKDCRVSTRQMSFNRKCAAQGMLKNIKPATACTKKRSKSHDLRLIPLNLLKPDVENAAAQKKVVAGKFAVPPKTVRHTRRDQPGMTYSMKSNSEQSIAVPSKNQMPSGRRLEKIIGAESNRIMPQSAIKENEKKAGLLRANQTTGTLRLIDEHQELVDEVRHLRKHAAQTRQEAQKVIMQNAQKKSGNKVMSNPQNYRTIDESLAGMAKDLNLLKSKLRAATQKFKQGDPRINTHKNLETVAMSIDSINASLKKISLLNINEANKQIAKMKQVHERAMNILAAITDETVDVKTKQEIIEDSGPSMQVIQRISDDLKALSKGNMPMREIHIEIPLIDDSADTKSIKSCEENPAMLMSKVPMRSNTEASVHSDKSIRSYGSEGESRLEMHGDAIVEKQMSRFQVERERYERVLREAKEEEIEQPLITLKDVRYKEECDFDVQYKVDRPKLNVPQARQPPNLQPHYERIKELGMSHRSRNEESVKGNKTIDNQFTLPPRSSRETRQSKSPHTIYAQSQATVQMSKSNNSIDAYDNNNADSRNVSKKPPSINTYQTRNQSSTAEKLRTTPHYEYMTMKVAEKPPITSNGDVELISLKSVECRTKAFIDEFKARLQSTREEIGNSEKVRKSKQESSIPKNPLVSNVESKSPQPEPTLQLGSIEEVKEAINNLKLSKSQPSSYNIDATELQEPEKKLPTTSFQSAEQNREEQNVLSAKPSYQTDAKPNKDKAQQSNQHLSADKFEIEDVDPVENNIHEKYEQHVNLATAQTQNSEICEKKAGNDVGDHNLKANKLDISHQPGKVASTVTTANISKNDQNTIADVLSIGSKSTKSEDSLEIVEFLKKNSTGVSLDIPNSEGKQLDPNILRRIEAAKTLKSMAAKNTPKTKAIDIRYPTKPLKKPPVMVKPKSYSYVEINKIETKKKPSFQETLLAAKQKFQKRDVLEESKAIIADSKMRIARQNREYVELGEGRVISTARPHMEYPMKPNALPVEPVAALRNDGIKAMSANYRPGPIRELKTPFMTEAPTATAKSPMGEPLPASQSQAPNSGLRTKSMELQRGEVRVPKVVNRDVSTVPKTGNVIAASRSPTRQVQHIELQSLRIQRATPTAKAQQPHMQRPSQHVEAQQTRMHRPTPSAKAQQLRGQRHTQSTEAQPNVRIRRPISVIDVQPPQTTCQSENIDMRLSRPPHNNEVQPPPRSSRQGAATALSPGGMNVGMSPQEATKATKSYEISRQRESQRIRELPRLSEVNVQMRNQSIKSRDGRQMVAKTEHVDKVNQLKPSRAPQQHQRQQPSTQPSAQTEAEIENEISEKNVEMKVENNPSAPPSPNESALPETIKADSMNDPLKMEVADMASITTDLIRSGTSKQYLDQLSNDLKNPAYSHLMEMYHADSTPKTPQRTQAKSKEEKVAQKEKKVNVVIAPVIPAKYRDSCQTSEKFLQNSKQAAVKPTAHTKNRENFYGSKEAFISVDKLKDQSLPQMKSLSKVMMRNLGKKSVTVLARKVPMVSLRNESAGVKVKQHNVAQKVKKQDAIPELMRVRATERERNLKRLVVLEDKIKKLEMKHTGQVPKAQVGNVLDDIHGRRSSKYPAGVPRRIGTSTAVTYNKENIFMGAQYRKSYSNINTTDGHDQKKKDQDNAMTASKSDTHIEKTMSALQNARGTNTPPQPPTRNAPLTSEEKDTQQPITVTAPQSETLQWKLPIAKRKNILPTHPKLKNTEIVIPKKVQPLYKAMANKLTNYARSLRRSATLGAHMAAETTAVNPDEEYIAPADESVQLAEDEVLMESATANAATAGAATETRRAYMPYAMRSIALVQQPDMQPKTFQFDENKTSTLRHFQYQVREQNQEIDAMKRAREKEKRFTFTPKDIKAYTNTFGRHLARLRLEDERNNANRPRDADEYYKQLSEQLKTMSALPRVKERAKDEVKFVYKPRQDNRGIREVQKPSLSEVRRTIVKHLRSSTASARRHFIDDHAEPLYVRHYSTLMKTVRRRHSSLQYVRKTVREDRIEANETSEGVV